MGFLHVHNRAGCRHSSALSIIIIPARMKARRMEASPLDRIRFSLLFHLCLLLLFYEISKFPSLSMFTCSRKPLYFGGALLSPYEPMDGAHFFFCWLCMHVVSEGRAFYLLPNVFFFLHHPIANKANMKGGGSEMPAKRKMRKERRKDKPKKTKKKQKNGNR